MKEQILKANEYYRAEHPGAIIFYKLKDGYVVFGEEASKVGSLLNICPLMKYGLLSVTLDLTDFFSKVEILAFCGIGHCAVSYLNDEGQLAIPDVERLLAEKEFDY